MIVRNKIDKKIKRILSPTLREFGFASINNRCHYALHNDCTWVFNINHVGSYYSELSGWTAQSLNATVGIYYDFIPPIWSDEEKYPKYYDCQLQLELCSQLEEADQRYNDHKKFDQSKEQVWWFNTNGNNIEEVIIDIKNSFLKTGLPWLKKYSNIESAFEKIEGEMNSYHKFYKAKFFAKYLNQWEKYERYNQLFKVEATKFGE